MLEPAVATTVAVAAVLEPTVAAALEPAVAAALEPAVAVALEPAVAAVLVPATGESPGALQSGEARRPGHVTPVRQQPQQSQQLLQPQCAPAPGCVEEREVVGKVALEWGSPGLVQPLRYCLQDRLMLQVCSQVPHGGPSATPQRYT